MTSRERVLTALKHQQPDRVPKDLGGVVTGIHRDAYNRLLELLGIEDDTEIMDVKQQLAKPCEEVLERLGIDTRYVFSGRRAGYQAKMQEDEKRYWYVDEWGIEWTMPKDSPLYFDMTKHPLQHLDTEDLKQYPWPDMTDPGLTEGVSERARDLHENTDYAVVTFASSAFLEFGWYLRGFEDFLMDLVVNENFMNALLDKIMEMWQTQWERHLQALGDNVDVVQMAGDLGHQGGTLISRELYEKYFKPRQKELVRFVRDRTDAFIFWHTCGSVYDFIPDLIEVGIDILNPVQVSARDMEPERLKEEFGDHLSFWGGVDTQSLLPNGTPEQVAEETRRTIDILGREGGYVLNSVHNIQADVPADNILAMFDAAGEPPT
ncbi:MAG: uroporphyrinogen decarboxylase family protein [Armatimonadota bacterium]